MKPRRTIVLILAFALTGPAMAGQEANPLAEADALYRDGQFARAATAYREALHSGFDGPRVHYNLANALYRSGKHGEAIAHYLAALVDAPRDADIRANLDRALAKRPAGQPAPSASWFHAAAVKVVRSFTLSEFAAATAVAWWGTLAAVIALLLGVRRSRRRRVRALAITLAVLTLVLTGFALARWWGYHATRRAVVAVETAQLRTGPGESFEVAMPVQEGWTMRVVRRDADWAEVIGEGGVSGWLPTSSLAMVRPDMEKTPDE